jgi:hypothetical protein
MSGALSGEGTSQLHKAAIMTGITKKENHK